MKDLIQPILDLKAKKIRRSPCPNNRASSIGYFVPMLDGCLRRGVYERTRWQEKELHDTKTQLIFDEGHLQEGQVLRDLSEAGVPIIEQQSAFEWKEYQISGHMDGVFCEDGAAYPVEIKTMHPAIYDGTRTIEDFKKHSWTKAYLAQIAVYMLLKNIDKGIFILKNKSNGELKQLTVDLDYALAEACIKACEEINRHIKAETLPDRITDIDTCADCPFKLICLPELSWGTPLKIADDPQYEKKLAKYLELKALTVGLEAMYDGIREKAMASIDEGTKQLNAVVGKFSLTGKKDAKGTFRLKISE